MRTFAYMFNVSKPFLYYVDTDITNLYYRRESGYENYDYTSNSGEWNERNRGLVKAKDIPVFSFRCNRPFDIGCEDDDALKNDR